MQRSHFRFISLLAFAGLCAVPHTAKAQNVLSVWQNPLGGNWDVNANWSTDPLVPGTVPGTVFDALFNLSSAPYTVTLSSNVRMRNITLATAGTTLAHSSGTLTLDGTLAVNRGTYLLTGGEVIGGTVNVNFNGRAVIDGSATSTFRGTRLLGSFGAATAAAGTGLTLDACTLTGSINVEGSTKTLTMTNGFGAAGTTVTLVTMYSGTTFSTPGIQTFGRSEISLQARGFVFGSPVWSWNLPTGSDLTISPECTIAAERYNLTGGGTLRNTGTIRSYSNRVSGETLTLAPSTLINTGTLFAQSVPMIIAPTGSFVNTGILQYSNELRLVMDATPELIAAGQRVENSFGFLSFTGNFNNAGRTTVLSSTLGEVGFLGSTVSGGTLDFGTSGATLGLYRGASLSGVTATGAVKLRSSSDTPARISDTVFTNGLTTSGNFDALSNVQVAGGTFTPSAWAINDNALTIAAGVNVNLAGASFSSRTPGVSANLVNNAQINIGVGRSLSLTDVIVGGAGSVVVDGGSVTLNNSGFTTPLLVSVGNVTFAGTYPASVITSINRTGGDVFLKGVLNNTGSVLTLANPTPYKVADNQTLTIRGGVLTGAPLTTDFLNQGYLELAGVNIASQVNNIPMTISGVTSFTGGAFYGQDPTQLLVNGGTTLAAGTIRMDGNSLFLLGGAPIRLSAGAAITGANQSYTGTQVPNFASLFINEGRMTADTPGRSLGLFASSIETSGVLEARAGGSLFLAAAPDGSVRLGGSLLIEPSSGISVSPVLWASPQIVNNGSLYLGRVDLNGGTLDLGALSSSGLTYLNESVRNGVVRGASSGFSPLQIINLQLLATNIAFERNLRVSAGQLISASDLITSGELNFAGGTVQLTGATGRLGGGGRFSFSGFGQQILAAESAIVTIESGTSFGFSGSTGISAQLFTDNGTILINNGRVFADGAGLSGKVQPSRMTNNGSIETINGATLEFSAFTAITNLGSIRAGTGSQFKIQISAVNNLPSVFTRWQNLIRGPVYAEGTGSTELSVTSLDLRGGDMVFATAPRIGAIAGKATVTNSSISNGRILAEPGTIPTLNNVQLTTMSLSGNFLLSGFTFFDTAAQINASFAPAGAGANITFRGSTVNPVRMSLVTTSPTVQTGLAVASDLATSTIATISSTVTATGGINITAPGTLLTSASLRSVAGVRELSVRAPRIVNSGTMEAFGSTMLMVTSTIAAVEGSGRILNQGTIEIAEGARFIVTGEAALVETSRLWLDLAAYPTSLPNAMIASTGRMTLGGELRLTLSAADAPSWTYGRVRLLASGQSIDGAFSSIVLPSLGNGLSFDLTQTANSLSVRVIPATPTAAVLLTGLLLATRRRR